MKPPTSMDGASAGPRVLLLLPTTSYKAEAFLSAAERVGAQVVVGTDHRQTLESQAPAGTLVLRFSEAAAAVEKILARGPFEAVIGVDDETTAVAALAGGALGLRHNPIEAVRAAADKHATRRLFREAGLRVPLFELISLDSPPGPSAWSRFPCVVKPLGLSASCGVLRADDTPGLIAAVDRIAAILDRPEVRQRGVPTDRLLVEEYLPGDEVALEGVLTEGRLQTLALFDKPDPLDGPTFEETLYVTPSRLPAESREAIVAEVGRGCAALGLSNGPVHAEARILDGKPWLLEVAPRTIGGLCSRTLRFAAGLSLEELILRHALGQSVGEWTREFAAAGVMMLPIPRAGTLRKVEGIESALAIEGIEDVTISRHCGAVLEPLPEGNRYLGFVFARGGGPAEVEQMLRAAHATLRFVIE